MYHQHMFSGDEPKPNSRRLTQQKQLHARSYQKDKAFLALHHCRGLRPRSDRRFRLYRSSRDCDKYEDFGYTTVEGAPIVNGKFAGRLILDAINFVDNETHYVVFARLVETVQGEGTPMTYDYFHRVIKGKAPKNAPTYVEEDTKPAEEKTSAEDVKKHRYQCIVCGHIVEAEGNLPADYTCPLCKAPKDRFERVME